MGLPDTDIRHENLDEYLLEKLNEATPAQIERIPSTLFRRLNKDKKWRIPDGISFNDYTTIFNSLGRTVFILVEDADKGLGVEEFVLAKKAIKREKANGELPTVLRTQDVFVLGNREVAQGLSMYRTAAVSKAWKMSYGLGKKPLGNRNNRYMVWMQAMRHYVNALIGYECNRKVIYVKHGLNHSQWYALLFLYFKEAVAAQEFVQGIFTGAFSNSYASAFRALTALERKGLVARRGSNRNTKYSIVPAGMEIVDKVISEYMIAGL